MLVEEGGFIYDSNAYNDDIPYYVRVSDRWHLVVPYSLTYNDSRYVNGGYSSPADFLDYCRRGLDQLRDEADGAPRMMSVGLHPRFAGQAARASAVRDLVDYALATGDIWIATRRDIAQWWWDNVSPE